ncbi:hypothetical protein [Acidocella sp.]|uniref:hypothetical protein n=1 Tax=Acidocella sp. TaxID=50710 RepID=UPI003CFE790D
MNQLHHHKMDSGFDLSGGPFNPDEFIRQWQSRAFMLLQAQERIVQGLAAAARAQLRFSQEFMLNRVNMLHWDAVDGEHLSEHARQEIEHLGALIHEVSDEIRTCFNEAGEMLEIRRAHDKPVEAPAAKPQEPAKATVKPPEPVAKAEPKAKAEPVTQAKPAPSSPPVAKTAPKATPARVRHTSRRVKTRG